MSKSTKTKICSIFGQIEAAVGDAMAQEGKVIKIPFEQIPPTVAFNDKGTRAYYALVFTVAAEVEFNRRVADLRA
jgi:hypothetical protein